MGSERTHQRARSCRKSGWMIKDRRVLGVIAARGGSKGLPRKNVLPLRGKPLIAWSIEAAAKSRLLDRAVVSTDDAEIADTARRFGGDVPFLRPLALATDNAPIVDVVLHALDTVPGDYALVVLLQAASPLRAAEDIDAAIERCATGRAPACVSVTAVAKNPAWMFLIGENDELRPLLAGEGYNQRRQDLLPVFYPNGAVYVTAVDVLRQTRSFFPEKTVAHVMPPERSIDIDTLTDFKLAEMMMLESLAKHAAVLRQPP